MRGVALVLATALVLVCLSPVSAQENITLENVYYKLSLLENFVRLRLLLLEAGLRENVSLLMQLISSVENGLNSRIDMILDLLNLFTPPPSSGISVFVIHSEDRGFAVKRVSPGLENVLSLRPGPVILQVKKPDGSPASGSVVVTPPIENTFLPLLGGQPNYQLQLSNGMSMVSLFAEGLWMFEVRPAGYPSFTFFVRAEVVEEEAPPPSLPSVLINILGEFRRGRPCIIRATDTGGKTLQGTLRVLDVGNPLGVVEGPNPMPYTPRSESISVSFLQNGEEKASRTFSEIKGEEKGGLRIPVVPLSVAVFVVFLLLLLKKVGIRKIQIPR